MSTNVRWFGRGTAAALVTMLIGCGDSQQVTSTPEVTTAQPPSTTAAPGACAHPQSVEVQGGDVAQVNSLADFGHLGASVLVVRVAATPPRTALDEDPAASSNVPHVFTRYIATVDQVVVWPDSAPTPAIGDELALDVRGGTIGCFTLVVQPTEASLEPGGTYLVAAGVRAADQLTLWDDRYAMKITDGVVGDPGMQLPTVLAALIGTATTALPPPSVVESAVQP